MTQEVPEAREQEISLGAATWTDLASRGPAILLIPLGSCEQHGPHLPLDTDARIAAAVAEAVSRRRTDVIMAPCLAYGASGEHQAFPGTLSIGTDALTETLIQLGRSALPENTGLETSSASAFDAVVFVNGHGGNHAAVERALRHLQAESRRVTAWAPRIEGGDAHAGRTETSLLLHIAPHQVRDERPVGAIQPLSNLARALRVGGVASVSESGVLGDATGASAEEGAHLLAQLVDQLEVLVEVVTDGLPLGRYER